MEDKDELITLSEAEKRFGITREGIYYHVRKCNLQTFKRGGDKKTYVKVADMVALTSFRSVNDKASQTPDVKEEYSSSMKLNEITSPDFSNNQSTSVATSPEEQIPESDSNELVHLSDVKLDPHLASLFQSISEQDEHIIRLAKTNLELLLHRESKPDLTDGLFTQWLRVRPDLIHHEQGILFPIMARISRAAHFMDVEYERWTASFGLKYGELKVLNALQRAGEPYCLTPTALLKALLITSGTVTKRLDRLEAMDLVKREPDPTDRRGVLVYLTQGGYDMITTAINTPNPACPWVIKALKEEEREILNSLLRKLLRFYELKEEDNQSN